MADLAAAFHWAPDAMSPMGVIELARWRERARIRIEAQRGTKGG